MPAVEDGQICSHAPSRQELALERWMPLDVLHPRRVLAIFPHDGIFLFKPPIEHFDTTISEAGKEHR